MPHLDDEGLRGTIHRGFQQFLHFGQRHAVVQTIAHNYLSEVRREEDVIEIAAETGAYHVSTMCCTYRGRGGLEREWLIDSLGWGDGGDARKIIFGPRHHLAAHAVVRGGDEVCVAVGGRGSGGGIALCGGVHASTETNECSRLLWWTRASDRYRSSLPVLVNSIREIKC